MTSKLTPNLIVASVERSLAFWGDRIGFEKTVEVPHGEGIGFAILVRDDLELMLQSRASFGEDVPAVADGPHRAVLYFQVDDLGTIREALSGYPLATPERATFYGTRELIVRDPDGHLVFFAQHE